MVYSGIFPSLLFCCKLGLTQSSRFGWTGFTTSIHWIVPTIAGGMVGFGIITIFMQCFNYLLDTYLQLYFPFPSLSIFHVSPN